jgi:hypothetical protein
MSDINRHRSRRTWPERQRLNTRDSQREPRELPATDPAELARFAEHDPDATDSGLADAYIDLGPADTADSLDTVAMGADAEPDDDGFDDAGQVDLDPA